jgi:hypothetical protein
MAATLITANADPTPFSGWESRKTSRLSEIWTVTGGGGGSADGDTGTITTYMKRPQAVIGAVSYTISGQAVTVTAITALGDGEVLAVEVIGANA